MVDRTHASQFSSFRTSSRRGAAMAAKRLEVFGDFVAGKENRLARFAIDSILEARHSTFNPLVLFGAAGVGKTHLAQGLLSAWKGSRRDSVCLTGSDFARQLSDAIESQSVESWRQRNRSAHLFVLDGLAQLAEKPAAQQELARTLDAILRREGQILITASTAPTKMAQLVPALRSRLVAGLCVGLTSPGPESRRVLLRRLAAARDITLSAAAIDLLADELPLTASELSGTLMTLERTAGHTSDTVDSNTIDSNTIDLAHCREHVDRVTQRGVPTLRAIGACTARYFSLKVSDLKSGSRQRATVRARGVAMSLARRLTTKSLGEIGTHFGGRDHTTALYNIRKTEGLLHKDSDLEQAVESLTNTLSSR